MEATEAAMAAHRVKYVLATKLVYELAEAADAKQLSKAIARSGWVDLLCLDELGLPGSHLDQTQVTSARAAGRGLLGQGCFRGQRGDELLGVFRGGEACFIHAGAPA